MKAAAFYDLKRLFYFRDSLERIARDQDPLAMVVDENGVAGASRMGILPGSFNPPTMAHVDLARRAKGSFQLDRVLFAMSRVTVDKEQVQGLTLEDRLLLLSLIAGGLDWASVAIVNRGLYYEQAEAFRFLLGHGVALYFIVGLDKVFQIFDPRYYQDREAALKKLFTEAQMIAAGRGAMGEGELERLLERPENRLYRDRIYPLTLAEGVRGISSSALRKRIGGGESARKQLPELVGDFISETRAYHPEYEYRRLLLDRLFAVREWAEAECDLRVLIDIALENSTRGKRLRELLYSDKMTPLELRQAFSELPKARSSH